ncbi:MAG: arginyl-tRNA synthetase [Candidatus Marinamargulisbacteria bacterium]|jgi:arginyl-tRNA synthetase
MIKHEIEKRLHTQLLTQFPIADQTIVLEKPKNMAFGDYATNICFALARTMKTSPKAIAESMTETLNKESDGDLRFEPMNGFINIKLSNETIWEKFMDVSRTPAEFPVSPKKVLLEYVSANPTGPLHIGHGRWAVLGDVLARLLTYTNHQVSREFYINDAGNQIKLLRETVAAVKEGRPIPEDGYHGAYIQDLAKSSQDPVEANLEHHKKVLQALRVEFDCWYSEKSLHGSEKISAALEKLSEKSLTYEKDDALWFKSESLGDEKDRVLIKKDKSLTYFTVDLAYHYDKVHRGYERLINIWGADHHGYVQRVRAGVAALCGDAFLESDAFNILIGQLVSLSRDGQPVRMSKRTGEIITLDEVIEEIGIDATRFFLVQKSPDTHVDFDLDLAKKKSAENPVYYIQYAHARICSILRKLELPVTPASDSRLPAGDLDPKERQLLFHCLQLNDEMWNAATLLLPHKLAAYTFQLARFFHHFYEACPIVKAESDVQARRLAILYQVKSTLQICLDLLGLSAPESM